MTRLETVWHGFLLGLAFPLLWLTRKRIEWTLRLRYWHAKRIVRRCGHKANPFDCGDPNCTKCGKEIR